jgi:hypothetical protein
MCSIILIIQVNTSKLSFQYYNIDKKVYDSNTSLYTMFLVVLTEESTTTLGFAKIHVVLRASPLESAT